MPVPVASVRIMAKEIVILPTPASMAQAPTKA